MTTLAKLKEDTLSDIESQAGEIVLTRYRAVEAAELSDEIKTETDQGLSSPYPVIALFYGKQRAIIRGLTESDVMYFDLPTVSEWSAGTNFTLPKKNKFGYLFVDMDGNDSKIYDPSLYYLTRKKDKTLSTLEDDSDAFTYPSALEDYSQQKVAPDSITKRYEIPLNLPVVPGTLKVYYDGVEVGRDNGSGKISGDVFRSATIDYNEKVILDFGAPPKKETVIGLVYDTYTGVDEFEKDYEQIDFTVTQKVDYGQALDLINPENEVINKGPELLSTMYLRRKTDHQQVGIIQIVCEGLGINTKWDPETGDPADYLKITHDQFKTLLGYLDPDISNDLTKSANPDIESTGRKDDSYSGGPFDDKYPDIEASPFFPWTDGDYIGSAPYSENWVHLEESVPIWSVHSDIKWQYGTAPENLGDTAQYNPGTFLAGLTEIGDFSGSGNNPIPADTGSSSSAGKSYEMVGDYVHEFDWYDAGSAPPYTKDGGIEYSCYYNDLQHLKDDHLTHLQTQCGLIATLGDVSNTVDTGRQAGDTTFVTVTATFKTALDTFLSYHDAFNPITGRPTYDTGKITTLKTAASTYNTTLATRVTDLDTVLGTATTSGYAKIIYDSCSMAVHMDIGYLRDVLDELNGIQDIYDGITDTQSQYALLP